MPVTPYVVGQWVRGRGFYGRSELLHEILHGNRNCLWLLGTRRVGKTSILKQLEQLTSESPELDYFPLFWDFQGAESPDDLHQSFAESLLDAADLLDDVGLSLEEVGRDDLFESLGKLRRELRSRNRRLLLLGDEVEELVAIHERAPAFLRRLRRAMQSAENIRTVLASKIKLWELANEETSTSPFLHGFTPPLYVRGLAEEDARALVRQSQLPEDSRPSLDEATVERIRAQCNHHPYLLQLLCERFTEVGDLDAAIEEIATDQMVRHFFAVDFEMLSEGERDIIRFVDGEPSATTESIRSKVGTTSRSLDSDLSRLEHLGFVRKTEAGVWSLANSFFKRWFSELPSVERAHKKRRTDVGLEPTVQDGVSTHGGEPLGCVEDRYDLLERLGRGATGEVFKAHDRLLGSVIALKLLKPEYCSDREAVVRLGREVLLSRDLSHPNVLKIYHLGDDSGQRYVTMQYADGPNLADVISRQAPLSPARAIRLTRKLAEALSVAHRANVLHRDIKPSNILLERRGGDEEPLLADFGLARLLTGPEVTRAGTFLGTPVYASPEQIRGEDLDGRSDLYSLGVVAFEMVTGRRPFQGQDATEVARLQVEAHPPRPDELRRDVSYALSDLILRCLAKDPNERFESAAELSEALRALEAN